MKIGLIKEGKVPPDKRVAFTPLQAQEIEQRYPDVTIMVEKSPVRCFVDDEYSAVGMRVSDDVSACGILMGIKEVPIDKLVAERTYFCFSHTIKKQPYNRKLLQEVLRKKITLIDYEALKDMQGNRLVAFGRYAGIVGAYNGLMTFGKRYNLFSIRRAFECFDVNDLKIELRKVKLPPIKIILTGGGRVGKGAMETLDTAGIRKVNPADFLDKTFDEPVYVQLTSADYHRRKDGAIFNRDEFHKHPELYGSYFTDFAREGQMLIAGAFWNPGAPRLFDFNDMRSHGFSIKVIADVTCDINGSIPSTKRSSTIVDPLYDFDPITEEIKPPLSSEGFITVMAIDNLPCELPRSASEEFGRDLIDRVLPLVVGEDKDDVIGRATIARNGDLTPHFEYLRDYVNQV